MTLPTGRSFQKIEALTIAEWNPRLITTEDFQQLIASIKDDPGFLIERPPLVADGDRFNAGGIVYAGNRRAQAVQHACEQGWEPPAELQEKGWLPGTVPVSVQDIPLELAKKRAIQDNTHEGEWQEQELAELVAELGSNGVDLELLGLGADELERIMDLVGLNGETETPTPFADFDSMPADPGFVSFRFGHVSGQVANRTYEAFAERYRQAQQAGIASLDDILSDWLNLSDHVPVDEELEGQPHGGALKRRRKQAA